MTYFGLNLTPGPAPAPVHDLSPSGQLLRHTTASLLAAVLAITALALLRPGALSASAVCAGAAMPIAWSYLVDCGNTWARMRRKQRAAAVLFVVAAGLLGAVLGSLVRITGD